MSNAHGASRRRSYGRRHKEIRARGAGSPEIDLVGPSGWSRGDAWDRHAPARTVTSRHDHPVAVA